MSKFKTILSALCGTVFIRVPLGIWLAAIFCGGWVALERHYGADYPVLPFAMTWPTNAINPDYPDNPGREPWLQRAVDQLASQGWGIDEASMAFGQKGFGVLLGVGFGLLVVWPCGVWKTMMNYSGWLLFPARVLVLAACYAALMGTLGGWLANAWGSHLLTSGYLAVLGLATPLIFPLPFLLLRPLFPSRAYQQALALIQQARRETNDSLAAVARQDREIGDVTRGPAREEWDYYGTVCGVFIGSLLAEKRGVSSWYRSNVEHQARKQLNKTFSKGEHGLTAVMTFCREQLEKNSKLTTETLVGLWLAMQIKGDMNPQRDRQLAGSWGAHLLQGMAATWPASGPGVGVLAAMLLWTGIAALGIAALEPEKLERQLAQLGWNMSDANATDSASADTDASRVHEQESATESRPSDATGDAHPPTSTTTLETPTRLPAGQEIGPAENQPVAPPAQPASGEDEIGPIARQTGY